MKRYLSILLTVAVILSTMVAPASAARPEIKFPVTFNGHPIAFDTEPEIINDRTFVPFRAIFEKMGADITYDAGTRTIDARRGNTTVKLTIGSNTAYVNGDARTLTAAPYIKNDRTMVPLRFVGEAFGSSVNYNPATTKISIVDSAWPRRGGTLNLAMWNAPEGNFNPIYVADTYGSNIVGMMYDGLWRLDEKLTPVPALAESWEWDSTGTQLTFNLRKDVRFHDGTPMTAADVVFTYKGIFHPKYRGPRNSGYEGVLGWEDYNKGVKGESAADFANGFVSTGNLEGLYAKDDYTVVFKLKEPNSVFLITQTGFGAVDHKRYANVPIQDWGTARDPNNVYPNGQGAFKMAQYLEGQYASLVANDDYWSGRPYVDKVLWKMVSTDVAVGEMQRGGLDMSEFSAREYDTYKDMEKAAAVKITEFPDLLFQMMYFNTAQGPTADKNVRQAISYAIDRNQIIHNLMKDHASTMYGPIHPLFWAYSEEVQKYDYNQSKAAELLDAAGYKLNSDGFRYKDGKKLSLRLSYPLGNPVRVATAPVVQGWLKAIGIDITLVAYDWPTINKRVFEDHDFDLQFMGFQLGLDPDPTGLFDKSALVPGGFNPTGWWTPRSEELIAKGKATGDIEQRMDIYKEWAQIFTADAPVYFFYAANTLYASNPRLQNFKPIPTSALWNLEEVWLSK